jgi:CarboxypepD_reg-like domain
MWRRILICIGVQIAIGLSVKAIAQEGPLIQYSGVVIAADSTAAPVSFASVFNQNLRMGTIANFQGFFTFAAHVGDTILISSVGYEKGTAIVPSVPAGQGYTATIYLKPQIRTLPEATVFPWFTKQQFEQAFLHMKIPQDDLDRAKNNLNPRTLAQLASNISDAQIDAIRNLQQNADTYYQKDMIPSYPILNPLAWMQFFNALKNGDLKDPNKE